MVKIQTEAQMNWCNQWRAKEPNRGLGGGGGVNGNFLNSICYKYDKKDYQMFLYNMFLCRCVSEYFRSILLAQRVLKTLFLDTLEPTTHAREQPTMRSSVPPTVSRVGVPRSSQL